MSLLITRYLAGFFFLVSLGLAALAIYRGEVISGLQRELIAKQDKQINLVIDSNAIANKISKDFQIKVNVLDAQKEVTTHEVERIVKEPVYLNTCFDASGLSVLHQAISAPVTSELGGSVQTDPKSN